MKLKIFINICLIFSVSIIFGQEVQTEIEGAIKIGNYTGDSTQANAGIIRWNGSDFEGWNGLNWRSLTSYILNADSVILPAPPIILPTVTSSPSSPLNNTRWTEGPLWTIDGNFINGNFDPSYYNLPYPRMGTTDFTSVAFITNNLQRVMMTDSGDVKINRNVYLNTEQPGTQTINNGPFTVTHVSPTLFSGILTVDKKTQFNSMLEVNGVTELNNTLLVNNQGVSIFPSEFKGAVNISDATEAPEAMEQGSFASPPVTVLVDATKGALVVDGGAGIEKNFNAGGDFAVKGSAGLGGPVSFYEPLSIKSSAESNTLWVGDTIDGALRVFGGTGIRGKLNVGNDFSVRSQPVVIPYTPATDPKEVFNVNATNGQVTINSNLINTSDPSIDTSPSITRHDKDYENYPLRVEGSNQGIAIKVKGSRSNKNNFVSFWDESNASQPTMWGRIEGEIPAEFNNDLDHLFSLKSRDYAEFEAGVSLGFATHNTVVAGLGLIKAITDFIPCSGFGVCVTLPGPADIIFAIISVASAGVQLGFAVDSWNKAKELTSDYNVNRLKLQGVTYASGAGDYAEYLLRSDLEEKISPADIVGIVGGTVSKNTSNSERIVVVSSKPIVLGNMPQPGRDENYEKIAFMGQVPVKVFGEVNIGDYIIPTGNNDGVGVAVHPSKIETKDIDNIVGVAWSESEFNFGYNLINVAVGLNRNDNNFFVQKLEKQVEERALKIAAIKRQINEAFATISRIEDGGVGTTFRDTKDNASHELDVFHEGSGISDNRDYEILNTDHGAVVSWEITEEDFEEALVLLEEIYRDNNLDFENDIVFKHIKNDLNFKNQMFESVQEKMHEYFLEHQEKYHNSEKH